MKIDLDALAKKDKWTVPETACLLRLARAGQQLAEAADDVQMHLYVVDSMGTRQLPPGEADALTRLESALVAWQKAAAGG